MSVGYRPWRAGILQRALLFPTLVLASAFGQVPDQVKSRSIIRITVNLVQVDAVVTDSKGRQVTNLKRSDFEVLEDGRPQQITNFSYVVTAPPPAGAMPLPRPLAFPPGIPPEPLRPQQARRTIAFVVDDLGLSFESVYYVRRALKKFVDEQMLPGDWVAIIRSSGGLGTQQQFTDNRQVLEEAIDRVRWYPMGRGGIGAFAPMQADLNRLMYGGPSPNAPLSNGGAPRISDQSRLEQEHWEAIYTVGTLGAISYVAKGLRDLPGRKSMIVLSDGFQIPLDSSGDPRVLESVRALVDLANRSSVVIYAVDPRGLQVLGLTAADNTGGRSAAEVEQAIENRRQAFFDSQAGMGYLAWQTGGLLVHDTNDLNWGFERILQDESGYYLIGYKPPEDDFRPGTHGSAYHKLRVWVRVVGLHVRSRSGFYGVTDEETRPVYHTRDEQMAAALGSLLGAGSVHVGIASEVLRDHSGPKAQSVLRVVLHIDPRDLSFHTQPDGGKKIVFDAAIYAFGEFGRVANAKYGTISGSFSQSSSEKLLNDGVDYGFELPVKKPGDYQLRAAVRDSPTGRVGSASQFIEVPNLRHGKLTMSGIILNAAGLGEKGPAVRRFQPGEKISFGFEVYNARLDPATHKTQFDALIRIFHGGRQVAAFPAKSVSLKDRGDPKISAVAGWIGLGAAMERGEYMVEASVTDRLAKGKNSAATQWIDFEISGAPLLGEVSR